MGYTSPDRATNLQIMAFQTDFGGEAMMVTSILCYRAGAGCRCWQCQLEQEMRTIPAKYLSQRIRTDLSKILDPVVELPDRDYRYFADRNGLVPQITKVISLIRTPL